MGVVRDANAWHSTRGRGGAVADRRRWTTFRRLAAAAALFLAAVVPALAHELIVFAYVEAGEVVVETRFTNGRPAIAGNIRVYDGNDVLVFETAIIPEGAGVTRFPVPEGTAATGLKVDVDTGEGHTNYWILTPADIAAQLDASPPPAADDTPAAPTVTP